MKYLLHTFDELELTFEYYKSLAHLLPKPATERPVILPTLDNES